MPGQLVNGFVDREDDWSDDGEEEDYHRGQSLPDKKSFLHFSVQDHEETPCHYLVPTSSEQEGRELRVGAARRRGSGASITWYFQPSELTSGTSQPTERSNIDLDYGFEPPFTAKMIPVNYTESVSVTDTGPQKKDSFVSFCDIVLQQRCKETVHVGPGLSPCGYRSSIVVFKNCSKRRYKNTVNYTTRMKPKRYEETNYVMGQRLERTFVSYMDYEQGKQKNWFTTSVELVPKTWSHNHVHNFQFRQRSESMSSCEECSADLSQSTSEDEGIGNGSGDINISVESPQEVKRLTLVNGDIDMTMVSSSLSPVSYSPEDSDSDTLSYRARLVVHGNRPPSYCGDDFQSNGYVSDDIAEL